MTEPFRESVVDGGDFLVGRFECPPESPMWRQENRIEFGPLLVVPGTGVEIEQVGHAPVITSAAHVILYNQNQLYRRRLIDVRGDRCFFFHLSPVHLSEMLATHGLLMSDDPDRPFRWPAVPLEPTAFAAHRLVVSRAFEGKVQRDALREEIIGLVDAVLAGMSRHHQTKPLGRSLGLRAREAVYLTQRYLIENFYEGDTLDELGERCELSPYHLARSFRSVTGLSVHQYRERLRIFYALEHLEMFDRLVDLAFEVGYSSHSHFTQSFRRMLGTTPAAASNGDRSYRVLGLK